MVVTLILIASGYVIARQISRHRNKRFIPPLISLWSLVFLLLQIIMGLEVYFRYVFDQTDNVYQIQTTQRWQDRHVAINAFGFRDEHFFQDKDPRETRVAVLGDSFTWGYGIENAADRYSDILENKLAARCEQPDRIKLYTLATPGRNTKDHFEQLQNMGHFNFDSVILGYYMDDASSEQSVRHFQHCYHRVFSYRKIPVLQPILDNSFSMQYLWVRLYNRFINPDYAKTCWDNNYASLYQDPEVYSKHLRQLQQLINYTRDKNMGLAVVIFPFMNLIGPDYPASQPAARLESFFSSQNIPVVNLAPLLANYKPNEVMANPRDFHANELVHRLVGEQLYEKIKDLPGFGCKP